VSRYHSASFLVEKKGDFNEKTVCLIDRAARQRAPTGGMIMMVWWVVGIVLEAELGFVQV
jgi:hypothetical protein